MTTGRRETARSLYRRRRLSFAGISLLVVATVAWGLQAAADTESPPEQAAAHVTTPATGAPVVPVRTYAPPPASPEGVYAHIGVGQFADATRGVPYRLYVPESAGTGVDVIDPVAMRVIAHFTTGLDPQHVVPSYDLRTLYSTNDLANSLTPISPLTGLPSGPNIPVLDPYNMYWTPDGRQAIVVAEALEQLRFYNARTFALENVLSLSCAGVDHADFSADGSYLVATCEFGHRLVKVDLRRQTVEGYLVLPGSSPQDARISPDGRTLYVADMKLAGVHLIDLASFREAAFLPTGRDAHGLYPSRDGRRLFVSNRGAGSISVIDFATRQVVDTWRLPYGGSPDMGGVSPDGTVLWLSGRYNQVVYKISTVDGRLLGQVRVPHKPHGLCVWPQPGRYSLGHTGNMR